VSRLTFRRLRVLIDHLPPESATKTALRDEMSVEDWESATGKDGLAEWGSWSREGQLLAMIADRIAQLEWALLAVNSEKGKAPKPPEPLPRPGIGAPPRAVAERDREKSIRSRAFAKALERNHGRRPTPEEVAAVLDEIRG
jgi:hypothetical protein